MKTALNIELFQDFEPNLADVEALVQEIHTLEKGHYTIEIEKVAVPKTRRQQNGYRWLCRRLGKQLGMSEGAMHHANLIDLGFYEVREIKGRTQDVPWSERRLSKEQESQAIDNLYQIAHFSNVTIPILDRDKAVRT